MDKIALLIPCWPSVPDSGGYTADLQEKGRVPGKY